MAEGPKPGQALAQSEFRKRTLVQQKQYYIKVLLLIINDLKSMTVIPLLWSQEGTCLSGNTAGFSIRWCQKANTDNAHSCVNYAHLQRCLSNSAGHTHPEGTEELFEISLRLAFTWNISGFEDPPARHN